VEKTININTILERVERVERELEELKIEVLKLQAEQPPAEEVNIMKTLIIIPAYNEELTSGSVVALAKKYGDVFVVDDDSKDRASDVARSAKTTMIKRDLEAI